MLWSILRAASSSTPLCSRQPLMPSSQPSPLADSVPAVIQRKTWQESMKMCLSSAQSKTHHTILT